MLLLLTIVNATHVHNAIRDGGSVVGELREVSAIGKWLRGRHDGLTDVFEQKIVVHARQTGERGEQFKSAAEEFHQQHAGLQNGRSKGRVKGR